MHLRLENFDGPLDLLLFLIKSQQLNIFNIPIVSITEQFLLFLKHVPKLDFYEAGEYLAMAAQLIEIKTSMLIPILQNQDQNPQNVEDIPDDDPRKPLIEQLLEFEALKKASEFLGQAEKQYHNVVPSAESIRRAEEFAQFQHPIQGNALDLVIALERVLLRLANKAPLPKISVKAQKITIQQKMALIKDKLGNAQTLTLSHLVEGCQSRYELIVTIMAILELCKAHHIQVRQERDFADIEITKGLLFSEGELVYTDDSPT